MGYQGQWYGMLRARATAIGPWERFGKNSIGSSQALFTLYSDQNSWAVSNIEAGRLKIDEDQSILLDKRYDTGRLFEMLLW